MNLEKLLNSQRDKRRRFEENEKRPVTKHDTFCGRQSYKQKSLGEVDQEDAGYRGSL